MTPVPLFLFLTILPCLTTVVRSDDTEGARKCAEELPAMYDKLCAKVKNDGNKVIEIKKKCVQYPDKLAELKVSWEMYSVAFVAWHHL